MFYTTCFFCTQAVHCTNMFLDQSHQLDFLVRLKDRSYYAIVIVRLDSIKMFAFFGEIYIYIYTYIWSPPPDLPGGGGVSHMYLQIYIYYKCHVFLPNLRMV